MKLRIMQFTNGVTGGTVIARVFRPIEGILSDRYPHLHVEMDYTVRRVKLHEHIPELDAIRGNKQYSGHRFREVVAYTDKNEIVLVTVNLVTAHAMMSNTTEWPHVASYWPDLITMVLNTVKAAEVENNHPYPNLQRTRGDEAAAA